MEKRKEEEQIYKISPPRVLLHPGPSVSPESSSCPRSAHHLPTALYDSLFPPQLPDAWPAPEKTVPSAASLLWSHHLLLLLLHLPPGDVLLLCRATRGKAGMKCDEEHSGWTWWRQTRFLHAVYLFNFGCINSFQ